MSDQSAAGLCDPCIELLSMDLEDLELSDVRTSTEVSNRLVEIVLWLKRNPPTSERQSPMNRMKRDLRFVLELYTDERIGWTERRDPQALEGGAT